MKRTATANWKGTGKEGKGTLSNQSGLLKDSPYTSASRFEEAQGTNPEELVAAAHAGCYSMKLAYLLTNAGFPPENIDTKCTMNLEGGKITDSHLECTATVPGIDAEKFSQIANEARETCPISKSLNMDITLDAKLAANSAD